MIDPIIRSLLPLANRTDKPTTKQLENDPDHGNSKTIKSEESCIHEPSNQIDVAATKQPQPSIAIRFSEASIICLTVVEFTIPRTELEEPL